MLLSRPWLLPIAALLAAVGAVTSPASAAATSENLGDQNLADSRIATSLNSKFKTQNSKLSPLPTPEIRIAQNSSELEAAKRLNQQAIQLYRQGRYGEAEPRLKQALEIHRRVLGDDHPATATSFNNLALLYRAQGRYGEAEPLFQKALEICRRVLGDDHPNTATSFNNLALLYQSQGRYGEAEPLFQQALEIRRRVLGDDHPNTATSFNSLALLYQSQGHYGEAEPLYNEALEIHRRVLGDDHPTTATSLNNLAALYHKQGRYGEAELLLKQTLAIRRRVLGDDHPDTALSFNNLAKFYRTQGRYGEAEPLLKQALAIYRRQLGEDHPDTATNLDHLANLYSTQGRYGEAEPLYKQALDIYRRVLEEDYPHTATSLNNLALLYSTQGRYGEAEPLSKQALEIHRRVLGDDHPATALNLNNLALLYRYQERYGEAEPLYQQALEIHRRVLGDDHPHTATSLNNLAMLYWRQGNLPQAVAYWNQGLDVEEVNLASLLATGSERRKQNYFATISSSTNWALSLHLQSASNNADAARLALNTLLRRKGRILDATSSGLQTLRQNLTPADQQLLDQLNAARSQLASLVFKGVGDHDPAQYRQQVAQLKGKADQLETQLSQRSAEFRVEAQPVTIAAVQQQIPADAALVELVRYRPLDIKVRKLGSPRYAAYVLQRQGDPKWVDLSEAEAIDQAAFRFRNVLASPLRSANAAAGELDELLMQPIRPLLGNAKQLLIAPDSQLNLIPFAALRDEQGKFLVERYEISYLTSGRDLLKLQLDIPSRQAPVLVANANFDRATPSGAGARASGQRGGNLRSQDFQRLQFGPLEGTKQEAEAIAPLLPKVKLLTEAAATENAVKQVKGPSILHIASHGFFLPDAELVAAPDYGLGLSSRGRSLGVVGNDSPGSIPQPQGPVENPLLRSGLALAGFNQLQSGSEDGALTALEASGLDLYGTQLVVLSACETGVGEVANGEGVYGRRRALVLAGARSQVISLWKVDDAGSKDWMVDYYQRLEQGMGRSAAARQVQLQMLQDPRYQHPYYWAAFIPSGDWRPMQF